jgi:hypothetical protein
MEEWRDIPGYEGLYQISNMRRVKSFKGHEKILRPSTSRGYLILHLYKNKCCICKSIHTLVAESFGEIPEGLQVNHKDGNKKNNAIENLELVTPSQNIIHAYDHGMIKKRCCVDIYTKDGKHIIQVSSMREPKEYIQKNSKYKRVCDGSISKVCNGKLFSAYGFIFKKAK